MTRQRRRIFISIWDVIAVLWLTLVFIFSSQPYEKQSIQPILRDLVGHERLRSLLPHIAIPYNGRIIDSQVEPYRFVEFIFRKGAHLFMYGTLAALICMVVYSRMKKLMLPVTIALLVSLSTAVMDEWNQLNGHNRTGSAADIVVDMAGASIGLILCCSLIKLAKIARKR